MWYFKTLKYNIKLSIMTIKIIYLIEVYSLILIEYIFSSLANLSICEKENAARLSAL